MRITIEDTDTKVMTAAAAFSNSTTPSTTQQPIDAGAPSASLLQAATTAATAGATDAGTPPDALLQALQNSLSINDSTSSRQPGDAGVAPTA